ncbi:MAG: DPP IV N-terminal domain-containing protein [Sphingomicrobium sp.]
MMLMSALPMMIAAVPATAALPVPTGVKQKPLTLERLFASPALGGSAPRGVKLSPDGKLLTMLKNRADDRERYDLWALDTATGQWRLLVDSQKVGSGAALSEAEKMQRERARIGGLKGIVTYDWSPDSKSLLVPIDGDLYLAALDGSVRRLTNSKDSELNPEISPKGGFVSFVRDQQLWVGPVGDEAKAVTPGGGTIHYGEAEFVAQEELDRFTGTFWSPNDGRIAVQWFDEANVKIVTRTSIGTDGTTTYDQRYPAAGTDNIVPHLIVIDPTGGAKVEVDLGADKDVYLARVDWAPDGRTLYVQRLNRVQDRLDMLAVDPATGKSVLLFSETARPKSWINLTSNYQWLKDGSLVWMSERSGLAQLYHFAGGQWRQLTHSAGPVVSLGGVDEARGLVYYDAFADDPLASQGYVIGLANAAEPKRLTDPAFRNSMAMDKQATRLLVSRSSGSQPSQSYLADTNGKRIAWINENALDASHPYAPYLASHEPTRYGTIKGPDGSILHYRMITPRLIKGKRYPVFFSHYGGPHSQVVSRGWSGEQAQYLVDRGYIWFEIDNRGSDHRGVEFERQIYHAMGSVEVQDQKAGADYLKSLPYVDPKRLAIYGWSYGGYMTLKMLAANPGTYAAGIAGAPVTKWELYDTAYTERYLGDPRQDPAVYARSNALGDASKIKDPLLVIHGMSDDNVVFENSTALFGKLQAEAVPFEMMVYPGYTHRVAGPTISVHVWTTILNFLDRHGVPGGPR